MRVGYRPAWPAMFIVLGVASTTIALLVLADSGFTPSLVIGPLLLVLGVLQLVRPYFHFDRGAGVLEVTALAGPMTRRFGGTRGERLAVADNRFVLLTADGGRRKVPVHRYLAQPAEWDAVVAAVQGR